VLGQTDKSARHCNIIIQHSLHEPPACKAVLQTL